MIPTIEGFQILEKIGTTNSSIIWRALQMSLERNVKIWIMRQEATDDPMYVANFERMTREVAKLKHQSFLPVIDIAKTADGRPYIIFESTDSMSITRHMKTFGSIEPKKAFSIAKSVAQGLDAAWKACGMIHRNIKPDNVRIDTDGIVRITNFDSATFVKPGEDPLYYDNGFIIGTPNYAAPEQADCRHNIDFHADMYGVGSLLYHMITGEAPFNDIEDPVQILEQHCNGFLPSPSLSNKEVTSDMVKVIARLMAKDPDKRYTYWMDFIEDVDRILLGKKPYNVGSEIFLSTIDLNSGNPVLDAILSKTTHTTINRAAVSKTERVNVFNETSFSSPTVRNPIEATPQDIDPSPIIKPGSSLEEKINKDEATTPAKEEFKQLKVPKKSNGKFNTSASFNYKKDVNPLLKRVMPFVTLALILITVYCKIVDLGPKTDAQVDSPTTTTQYVEEEKYDPSQYENIPDETYDTPSNPEYVYQDTTEPSQEPSSTTSYDDDSEEYDSPVVGNENSSTSSSQTQIAEASYMSQDELIKKIYNEICSKDIAEARNNIGKLFSSEKNNPNIDIELCKKIWAIIRTARTEADAAGEILSASMGTSKKFKWKNLVVEIYPQMYANGKLHGKARHNKNSTWQEAKLDLKFVPVDEVYNLMLGSAIDEQDLSLKATKTLLAIRLGKIGQVRRDVQSSKLAPLKVFIDQMK